MVIIELTYLKKLSEVEWFLEEHIQFLNTYYERGLFIASGRKIPRDGGIILARMTKPEAVEAIKADPFYSEGIAEYRLTEFELNKSDPRFFILDPDGNNIEAVCHDRADGEIGVIARDLELPISKEAAYELFVHQFASWWPKDYTWSQNQLQSINIEPKIQGRCLEQGPHQFQCQFGTVLAIQPNESITIAWQIDPEGRPQPALEHASEIKISFKEIGVNQSIMTLEHSHFQRHGKGYQKYFSEFNSEYGWDFILQKFKNWVI